MIVIMIMIIIMIMIKINRYRYIYIMFIMTIIGALASMIIPILCCYCYYIMM